MARQGIGLRITYWRGLAGKTQQEVADSIGVTREFISQVENGKKPLTRIDHAHGIAQFLGISFSDVVGLPYTPADRTDYENTIGITRIRAAIDEGDDPVEPLPIQELALAADRAMAARMACDVPLLGQHLPDLLSGARVRWFEHGDRQAGELLVKGAFTGSLALKSAGWFDLGFRLAELANAVATALGDPECIAAARFAVAQCALTNGSRRRSLRLAVEGAEDLDRLTRRGQLPALVREGVISWKGLLHLQAALSQAGLPHEGGSHTDAVDGHLAEAAAAARHVTVDSWRMGFGTANVNVWAIGAALESGNPGRVRELAARVDVSQLRTPHRLSRFHLDVGRARFLEEDVDGAVRAFLRADRAAPDDLRRRADVVEMVSQMVRSASGPRGGSSELRDLAVRVGVTEPDAS